MPLDDNDFLLEEYRVLHSKMNSEMTTLDNTFNYALVTLGISFAAIQAIFAQINEFSKPSSNANIDQLNSLLILLWVLLVVFVPFICIIFTLKWLSIYRSVAITGCWIASEIEDAVTIHPIPPHLLPLSAETKLRELRTSATNNTTLDRFLKSIQANAVFVFFLSIGTTSLVIGLQSIKLDWLFRLSMFALILYIICWLFLLYFTSIIIGIISATRFSKINHIQSFKNNFREKFENITITFILIIVIIIIAIYLPKDFADKYKAINPVEIAQNQIVSTYFKNVNLLIDDDGLSEEKRENTLSIVRGLTLQTIERLDELEVSNQGKQSENQDVSNQGKQSENQDKSNQGKSEIISFLYDFGLIGSTIGSTLEDGIECQAKKSLNLRRVNLENVKLDHMNMQCINLRGTLLKNANFNESIISGADLSYAILINANFTNANLWGENSEGRYLGVNFEGAELGADLTSDDLKKGLKPADLAGAYMDIRKSKADLINEQKISVCNKTDNKKECERWVKCRKNSQKMKICDYYSNPKRDERKHRNDLSQAS